MKETLFDVDRFSGITETFQKHEGKSVIRKHQDVKSIIDANKRELNSNIGRNWSGDFHKVASIPLIVIDMWREELKASGAVDCDPLSANNKTYFIAKINSSEWSGLRTKQGQI